MSNFPGIGGAGAVGTGSPDTPEEIKQKLETLVKGSRLSADYLDSGKTNAFITAQQAAKLAALQNAVTLGPDGKLPALDGSKLTNLPVLSRDQLFELDNRGIFSGPGSLKGLGEGWWYIESATTGITGKPSGSAGDLLVYKRTVGTNGVAMFAFGRDKDGSQVWAQYRATDNIGYSPWVKLSVTDTLTLDQIKAELIKEGWGPLSGGGETPKPTTITYYSGYDTAFPTSLSELTSFTSTKFTISRTETTPERIFVLVPKDHSSQVAGFIVSGGLQAVWAHRDLNIDGQSFRAFYSPGAYYETSDTIEIKFV